MNPQPDTIVVVTNSSNDKGDTFSLAVVSSFEVRANGVLVILNRKAIVRAYAIGHWETAFLTILKGQGAPDKN